MKAEIVDQGHGSLSTIPSKDLLNELCSKAVCRALREGLVYIKGAQFRFRVPVSWFRFFLVSVYVYFTCVQARP
jgi:hypothetical protein